jgi:hypothetical protein
MDQGAQGRQRTLGAAKQYQAPRFVEARREPDIVPRLQSRSGGNLQRNSLREEERNSADFQQSQRKRKLVEQNFAWIKRCGPTGQATDPETSGMAISDFCRTYNLFSG